MTDDTALRATLEKLTTDELEQRRSGMDYAVQGMVLQGVEVPDDVQREFLAVQEELAKRNKSKSSDSYRKFDSWTSLLGSTIDGYNINQLLSDGTFSWVMRATNDAGDSVVFKIAKPDTQAINYKASLERPYPTLAWNAGPFEGKPVMPSPAHVLRMQADYLQACAGGSLIGVENTGEFHGLSYYCSPFLEGFSLRHLHVWERDTLETMLLSSFISLCDGLHALQKSSDFIYHGDIKPSNIFITESGVTLLDPGYSGELECAEGKIETAMISTPQYYPLWEPDDLLAVGISLYEAVLNSHPLKTTEQGESEITLATDAQELVYFRQSLLQESLTPLLHLKRPSQLRSDLTAEMEEVILKGLRIRLDDDGLLHTDPGFVDFSEFSHALNTLRAQQ